MLLTGKVKIMKFGKVKVRVNVLGYALSVNRICGL